MKLRELKSAVVFFLLPIVSLVGLLSVGLPAGSALGAVIVVNTVSSEINDDGLCSLQEAIFSANFDDNLAIDPAHPADFVVTACRKGSGDDVIQLPAGAVFQLSDVVNDQFNSLGPTATPIIFTNMTIEANGSRLERVGSENMRAFAVGTASVTLPATDGTRTVSGTGELTLQNAYIKGFKTKGGNGAEGGGGGMGAGGAIYLRGGELTVVNSTFEGNLAIGGNANEGGGDGGGGGLSGNGGGETEYVGGGGGGGGSRGNGGDGAIGGGGGGGTLNDGTAASSFAHGNGGFDCGGNGGDAQADGASGRCSGGGGGGGGFDDSEVFVSGDGGAGQYGGGGGGSGGQVGKAGGSGGFGGGGGSSFVDSPGGNGGFGGGGGKGGDTPGHGGPFGGDASQDNGGGGAGLGGAIFNDSGILSVFNSTFFGNSAYGGAGAEIGEGQGNAIFSRNGNANLVHITVSDSSDPNGQDIVDVAVAGDGATATLHVSNSILANNKAGSPNGQVFFFNGGTVAQNNSGNLIENNGSNSGDTGVMTGVAQSTNPNLSALALNEPGDTPTMAIANTSSAYAAADAARCLPNDQRGVPRKTGCDIGAYEQNDFPQSGATLVVNTTSDHDPDVCSMGDCTLREAIQQANALPGANTITFANTVSGTIALRAALGQLDVTDSTTMVGPGARVLSVSGNAQVFRVLSFSAGTSTVSGLTIRDGFQLGGPGTSAGGAGALNTPGAVLTFTDCAFLLNSAHAGDSATASGTGATAQGGAIINGGVLTLNRCTLSDNGVEGGRGGDSSGAINASVRGGDGGAAQGGAIFNDASATLTINDCTLSGNGATGGAGGDGTFGGNGGNAAAAIFNLGTMTVTATTVASNLGLGGPGGKGNNAFNGGSGGIGSGGLTAGGGTSLIRNTISANNDGNRGGGPDVDGAFTSGGYNLIGIGDASTGFAGPGDQVGSVAAPLDAKLGLLQDNGGPTATMALLCGSPAIDQGASNGLTTDQRGAGRTFDDVVTPNAPDGDGTDIGAFELQQSCTLPAACAGDCSGNAEVTVDELLTLIDIALGNADVALCQAGNVNHDDEITIDEILTAINNALDGCPAV